MARFDVYANPDSSERKLVPFFLDVQTDHVKGLQTRVVVPLVKAGAIAALVEDLNPEFVVAGQRVSMDTPSIGAAPQALLRQAVTNISSQQMVVQNALDMLFGSY